MAMIKVARWGNSLALRLPVGLVRQLGIKEGDTIDGDRLTLHKSVDHVEREAALARIRAMRVPLPEGYKFDREEANARGPE
jgi:antitoxin MazE